MECWTLALHGSEPGSTYGALRPGLKLDALGTRHPHLLLDGRLSRGSGRLCCRIQSIQAVYTPANNYAGLWPSVMTARSAGC